MADLSHIIYRSRAVRPIDDAELSTLLFGARRWNAQHGITGRLMVLEDEDGGQTFVQWIEGDAGDLAACYTRIERDGRHDRIEVLRDGPIQARAYPMWSMRLERIEAAEVDEAVQRIKEGARGNGSGAED